MLDRCVNPACGDRVRYLRHGKLYALYKQAHGDEDLGRGRIEFFWLCEACAASFNVHFADGRPILGRIPVTSVTEPRDRAAL